MVKLELKQDTASASFGLLELELMHLGLSLVNSYMGDSIGLVRQKYATQLALEIHSLKEDLKTKQNTDI